MSNTNTLFIYLGRRGAIVQLSYEIASILFKCKAKNWSMCISAQNEEAEKFKIFGDHIIYVNTAHRIGSIRLLLFGAFEAKKKIISHISERNISSVITLMPHIWSPLISAKIRKLGVRYSTIIHDGVRHLGDKTGLLNFWLLRDMKNANVIFTLSENVAGQIEAFSAVRPEQICTILHPDFTFLNQNTAEKNGFHTPWRLLFFGRIIKYKGLKLLLDAVEILQKEGHKISLSVCGSGNIEGNRDQLSRVGAHVVNRWLATSEISELLSNTDAVVASHIESSQSGVVAAALGAGIPSIVTPVGGLREQIQNGVTGIISRSAEASQFASAIKQLFTTPNLYDSIVWNIQHLREERSMKRFVEDLILQSMTHNVK